MDLKHEKARLEALETYDLINKKSEDELDKITELAASICDAPVAKINLIGRDTQWTKSDFGSDGNERFGP